MCWLDAPNLEVSPNYLNWDTTSDVTCRLPSLSTFWWDSIPIHGFEGFASTSLACRVRMVLPRWHKQVACTENGALGLTNTAHPHTPPLWFRRIKCLQHYSKEHIKVTNNSVTIIVIIHFTDNASIPARALWHSHEIAITMILWAHQHESRRLLGCGSWRWKDSDLRVQGFCRVGAATLIHEPGL